MNAPHRDDGFFTETLASRDPEISKAIGQELGRQRDEIELIASGNRSRERVVRLRVRQRSAEFRQSGEPGCHASTDQAR